MSYFVETQERSDSILPFVSPAHPKKRRANEFESNLIDSDEERGAASEGGLSPRLPLFIIPPVTHYVGMERHNLSDRMLKVIDQLIPYMNRFAKRRYIPVQRIEVREFVEPEEDTRQITLSQWVDVPSETALGYWDELAVAVFNFSQHLPPDLAGIAQEQINIEVFWNDEPPHLFTLPL